MNSVSFKKNLLGVQEEFFGLHTNSQPTVRRLMTCYKKLH